MSRRVVVRSMLGVSPSAYQDACEAMGQENVAATMACILERAGQGRRISAQSDGQGAARRVFARAGVDGSVAGESSGCSKRLANGSLGVAVA